MPVANSAAGVGRRKTIGAADSSREAQWAGHIFCLSIVGMLLKQLRLIGESVGFFEISGLAAALFFIFQHGVVYSKADIYFTRAMTAITGAFVLGSLVALIFVPSHFSARDLLATLFIFVIVLGWVSFGQRGTLGKILLLRNYVFGYCALMLPFAVLHVPALSGLWLDEFRFMGLSDNPNQLAGLSVTGLTLTAAIIQYNKRIGKTDVIAAFCISAAGFFSLSYTMIGGTFVAALAAGLAYIGFRSGYDALLRRAANIAAIVIVVAAIGLLLLYWQDLMNEISNIYYGGYGKGSVRVAYWTTALGEALISPIVGFGPGGHISIAGTEQLQEAHNVFLDAMLSGGIVALSSYLMLFAAMWKLTLESRQPGLVFGIFALLVLGMFHTVLRHANYWIAMHAVLSIAAAAPGPLQSRRQNAPGAIADR